MTVSLVLEPVLISREDAAGALGISLAAFEQRVQPELKLVSVGRRRLVQVADLRAWAARAASPAMGEQLRPMGGRA